MPGHVGVSSIDHNDLGRIRKVVGQREKKVYVFQDLFAETRGKNMESWPDQTLILFKSKARTRGIAGDFTFLQNLFNWW